MLLSQNPQYLVISDKNPSTCLSITCKVFLIISLIVKTVYIVLLSTNISDLRFASIDPLFFLLALFVAIQVYSYIYGFYILFKSKFVYPTFTKVLMALMIAFEVISFAIIVPDDLSHGG